MIVLDGKKIAGDILRDIRNKVKNRHLKLKLAVILVGNNSASKSYINQKEKACEKIGIGFELFSFPKTISEVELKKQAKKIVANPGNSGVVVQLPLPPKINSQNILNIIPVGKDIDLLSDKSSDNFYDGKPIILPPVLSAINYFLKKYKISLKNKKIVVIGEGKLVGRPVVYWLLKKKYDVLVANKATKNIIPMIKRADVIISGAGQANLIKGSIVKRGAVVIDAGASIKSGKVKGDVDFKSVSKKTSFISPVPGGVGPLTVACLLKNLIKLTTSK